MYDPKEPTKEDFDYEPQVRDDVYGQTAEDVIRGYPEEKSEDSEKEE